MTGRTRPVLLGARPCGHLPTWTMAPFFRRLPGDGRISACCLRGYPGRASGLCRAQPFPVLVAGAPRCLRASAVSGLHRSQGVNPSSRASRTGSRSACAWSGHRQRVRW
ncbi:MAG: hypothetical protein DLM60_03675 [Pseudonocardiales bacterium]|nr:MAG: hypothetical protein DLM60_03675 [Pseudonocardiales bacterium]